MCTLSWWPEDQASTAYGVFFNRDESVRRSPAQPPAIHGECGCRFICPVDPDGGGTWIWVNEAGIIGCILNNYSSQASIRSPVSRGVLLKSLAVYQAVDDIQAAVAGLDCSRYHGFHLFIFDGCQVLLYDWHGDRLECRRDDQVERPLTTSGFRPREVVAYRRDLWHRSRQWQLFSGQADGLDRQRLERFHGCHDPDYPAYSPLMVRANSRTVSQSRIRVDGKRISFDYSEVDDCRLQPFIETSLTRTG